MVACEVRMAVLISQYWCSWPDSMMIVSCCPHYFCIFLSMINFEVSGEVIFTLF